ncbi:uncharacterized protein LOC128727228 [Anopheles nili]|uniref:uncharacterized protein LOC128727228 n=1 Tax=Anopheles nili TaxID=185578 RepID=UPI00237A2FA6|nr:uncharacterized protein LOC128727228 [Anopheles nili]
MGKRTIAAAIVDADHLHLLETPPKRMKHASVASPTETSPVSTDLSSPNAASASEFTLSKEFVDGTKLMDLTLKQWRIGKPIGKGSFGEIFLASDNIDAPVTAENAKYVVKIEPHSNGPLFVEIHCLLNTAKRSDTCQLPPGMPEYIASGSHIFKDQRYRFLILKRYHRDLHTIIKNKRVNPKSIPLIACQILVVLEHLHDQGYVHSDIKAENLMVGTFENKVQEEEHTTFPQNGFSGHHPDRSNGFALPDGIIGTKRRRKGTTELTINGHCGNLQENGLYLHQEQEMYRVRNLRPLKSVTYRDISDDEDRVRATERPKRRGRKKNADETFSISISPRRSGYEELRAATEVAHWNELKRGGGGARHSPQKAFGESRIEQTPVEDRIHLIDFGLASKFVDSSGQHRPFCMDQRRAHDGTLEFTSRDAHMGAHARRSDLECLGYNLVYWSQGFLPWKDEKLLNQPEQVHRMKEYFMTDVREMLHLMYGDNCPAYLGDFLSYVGNLTYDERPDYQYCKSLFYKELKRLGCPVSRNQPLRLDITAIEQLSETLTAQDEAEITNKINHVKSLMKLGALFPLRESTLHSKATKNLRSKRSDQHGRNSQVAVTVTDGGVGAPVQGSTPAAAQQTPNGVVSTICTRRKDKHLACEEIFATDADQIARERIEKEYERAEQMEETVIRYTGKPTYAIQELLERKIRGHSFGNGLEYTESEGYIKGYTKPMMDILRKRQSQLFREIEMSTVKSEKTIDFAAEEIAMQQDEEDNEDDEKPEVSENESSDSIERKVRVSKYEHDEDYQQQDDDDEDMEELDDQVASEETEEDEMVSDEEDEDENNDENEFDEEDEEQEEDEEEEEVEDEEEVVEEADAEDPETVIKSEYQPKGSYRIKSRKKEDTDSDFINDGGCEEEEEEYEQEEHDNNVPVGEDAEDEADTDHFGEEEDEEDQQDSDFNDQESTATDTEEVIPVKRHAGRPPGSRNKAKKISAFGDSVNGRIAKSIAKSQESYSFHDNDVQSRSRKTNASGKKQRVGRRRKHHVLDDGDGDNARLFEDSLVVAKPSSKATDGGVNLQQHHPYNNNNHCNSKAYYGDVDDSSHDMAPPDIDAEENSQIFDGNESSKYRYMKRRKSGLRERIRPTDRGNDYADDMQRKRKAALRKKRFRESIAHQEEANEMGEHELPSALEDDYSCSSSASNSHSVASSCSSNHSRLISNSSSTRSSDIISSTAGKRRGRKRKQVPEMSSRESSRTRQQRHYASSATGSRKTATVTTIDAGHTNSRWSRSNSNSSHSAATSRSSSVSASMNSGGGSDYAGPQPQLATLPEQSQDSLEDDDGDDTRDIDYSPISTRRKRKALALESHAEEIFSVSGSGHGGVSRKTNAVTNRKRIDSKGGIGKGTGSASSSSATATNATGLNQSNEYASNAAVPRRIEVSHPPVSRVAGALIQQQQRGRRPQHHVAYQNYYQANERHHLPSTMLVRTYSRG